jgi:phosphoenolpyruvate synthase/pyruvate phosphate dikinase
MKEPSYQVYIRNDWPLPFVQPWAWGPTNVSKPPFQWDYILVANLGDKYAWCYREESVIKLGHSIDKHLSNPKNLQKFSKEAKLVELENRTFAEKISITNLENKTLAELSALLSAWYVSHSNFTTRFMPIDATDETLEKDIREQITNYKFQISNENLSVLLTPNAPSYVQKEHAEFCALVKKFGKNLASPAAKKAITQHSNKWWWTVMGWGQHNPLDEKTLIKNIAKIKNIPGLLAAEQKDTANRHKILRTKKQLLKTLPQKVKNLLAAFEVLAGMHDTRKEMQMKMMNAGMAITKQILRKSGISLKYQNFILIEEYIKMAGGNKLHLTELEKRKKAYWCEFTTTKKIVMVAGKKALEKIKQSKIGTLENIATNNVIKGIPASPGIAKGKARVGLKAQDVIRSIKPGEILVTSQTTPEFAPAMKKAAAIITDEGGITSHAAIVSRELGIPCVIGTKHATHHIKTGDLLEVDANTGIIRKL